MRCCVCDKWSRSERSTPDLVAAACLPLLAILFGESRIAAEIALN